MEKYESIGVVGEGSYGIVMKCRHKETGTIVAIKKFIETEDDHNVRKMALREIRMLKKLHHDNLVNMIEVFRRKRRFYLVFEYMDHTVLDELEENPKGLGERVTRQHMFQVIRGIDFCHKNNIVHRDVKPENILVSNQGVIKLCDFGFARLVSSGGETYTDYVATRWYRAPELLVGETKYGRAVDIWAIGCLFAELMSGDPLFPGESDIDQLYQIMKLLGKLCTRHQQLISKNPLLKEMKKSNIEYGDDINPSRCLYKIFPSWPNLTLDIVALCLRLDPSQRPTSSQLLQHSYFTQDRFSEFFVPELRKKVEQEFQGNPLLSKIYLQLVDTGLEKKGSAELCPPRRSSQVEVPRWKLNYGGEKASSVERQQTLRDLDGISISKRLTLDCSSPMELGGEEDITENNNNVKFSSLNLNKYSPLLGSLKPLHDSNLQQQPSLTPTTLSLHTGSPSPFNTAEQGLPTSHHTLHPSVTVSNISLQVNNSYRNDFSKRSIGPPKPGMGVVPRTQMVRKLEQRLTMDMEPRPAWKPRGPNDDFSLPNLPGASLSPHKVNKKKLNPVHSHGNVDSFISPMQKSRSPSISPHSRVVSNLPFV